MTAFSVLDLVPVREGGTLEEAFAATASLAAAQARAARFTPAATAAAMTAIYRDALGSREDAA